MPLFKDVKTYEIVFRQHEINSEAIDGLIELISEDTRALIVKHIPNNKWSFDVLRFKEGSAAELYEDYKKLPKENDGKPIEYFKLILLQDFEDYVKEFNFNLLHSYSTAVKPKSLEPNIINIIVEKDERDMVYPASRLVRDNEITVFKYKPPNQR